MGRTILLHDLRSNTLRNQRFEDYIQRKGQSMEAPSLPLLALTLLVIANFGVYLGILNHRLYGNRMMRSPAFHRAYSIY